ncbi:MAG: SUMF1/EgtB/PvdO family nonheme iron enzyme [Planctomycetaceae bacterium]|jgi:formylglycine-generating enzyme required for sulfatase activity|nr:SUMF1/EgtB/PvdO family nonheme iron enzyme [Planctomycetaceae bacterium]MCE2813120.1 SUMF1/EgtB/PvdO family nonheme iron enzyme [Planctomycetaceae bacterium]
MSITPRCFVSFMAIAMCLVYETLGQEPKEISNSIGMKMVLIPKGTFMMGSPTSEEGRNDDEVQHEVTITRDFYLGAYEVTQSQYERVMGHNASGLNKVDLMLTIGDWQRIFCLGLERLATCLHDDFRMTSSRPSAPIDMLLDQVRGFS